MRSRTRAKWLILGFMLILTVISIALLYALEAIAVPPRLLAPYLLKRAQGHNPVIVATGGFIAQSLTAMDRGDPAGLQTAEDALTRFSVGAQKVATPPPASELTGRIVVVSSTVAALSALDHAEPGDVITLLPGRYFFTGSYIRVNRPGNAKDRITVRAAQSGSVVLEFAMVEGFLVSAPYWSFENLTIMGICNTHSDCEHAFHVVGNAHHFVAHNNTIVDFNSHFKINNQDGFNPDYGILDTNTMTNGSVRHTANPVNVVDIVSASNWTIKKNLITDFFKESGNKTSYGGFAKGGGRNNVFENNIVLCEYRLRAPGTSSIGLSLGGGGTGNEFCRDKRCVTEQEESSINGNLIAACSDDGIYINKSSLSRIAHNTLIDTAGISIRFPASSANTEGNMIDGIIRERDGGTNHSVDDIQTSIVQLFVGSHPVRNLFDNASDFASTKRFPTREQTTNQTLPSDLCNTTLTTPRAYGAFSNFAPCINSKASSKGAVRE